MICFYHSDLDGRCAAAIVRKKFPECRFMEVDYNDHVDFPQAVGIDEHVVIVDFSFKPEKMEELYIINPAKNIIWIDHHKTAAGYGYDLPGLCDFSGKLSGCELTWKYFFPEKPMPEAVRLLGDYDTWRFDTKNDSMAFQFGMRAELTTPNSVIWKFVFGTDGMERVKDAGQKIVDYKNNVSQRIIDNGEYEVDFEGHTCFVVNTPMIDSDMFSLIDPVHAETFDFFISWVCVGLKYIVSMRSRGDIDVSAIAKKYGGGGHKGAAGFVCDILPWTTS